MTAGTVLLIDTATRQPVVGIASADGALVGQRSWTSRHRHGEQLLGEIEAVLGEAGRSPSEISAIVVGTGPGSFTGLRIGLATAKVLAYSLDVALIGVPTTAALAHAAGKRHAAPEVAVTLPAGATDRYVAVYSVSGAEPRETTPPALVADAAGAGAVTGDALLVAVEIEPPTVPPEAIERGIEALAQLAASLARLGAARLARGQSDDVERLVPAYVALPRGVAAAAREMTWSPDHR